MKVLLYTNCVHHDMKGKLNVLCDSAYMYLSYTYTQLVYMYVKN